MLKLYGVYGKCYFIDASYCYLTVNSLMIKGPSNLRTTLTSSKSIASLRSD